MTALTREARQQIRDAGLTIGAFARSIGWAGNVAGRWFGDVCGCSDDRCVGYHHDAHDDCGCLPVELERARATLCQVPRPDTWDDQRCVHPKDHDDMHRAQDGGAYR